MKAGERYRCCYNPSSYNRVPGTCVLVHRAFDLDDGKDSGHQSWYVRWTDCDLQTWVWIDPADKIQRRDRATE